MASHTPQDMGRMVLHALVLLSCVGLAAATATGTTNGYTCNNACGYGGSSYTWCNVNQVNGQCPSGTTNGFTGCWD